MKKLIQKILLSFISGKCYTSIEIMPIFNWQKIHDTKNLSFLYKSETISIHRKEPNKFYLIPLSILWRDLQNQYIKEFGFSESFIMELNIEKQIAELIVDKICNDDKSLNTMINIKKMELAELRKTQVKKTTFAHECVILKKNGYLIDQFKTSVTEYYTSLNALQDEFKNVGNG